MPSPSYWIAILITCLTERSKALKIRHVELEFVPNSLESHTIPKEVGADGQDSRAGGGCGIESVAE